MKIKWGKYPVKYGPGIKIELTGDEVALAISAWLVAQDVHVSGPMTIWVNGYRVENGEVLVDPSGQVVARGKGLSGRGHTF